MALKTPTAKTFNTALQWDAALVPRAGSARLQFTIIRIGSDAASNRMTIRLTLEFCKKVEILSAISLVIGQLSGIPRSIKH